MSETIPNGWKVKLAEEIYNRLKVPRVYDRSAVSNRGRYPIIDQSEDGQIGFVDAKPEFEGSNIQPLVTFANHTCAVRRMRIPFGVIQNVFPLKGKKDTDSNFIYHVLKGGVKPEGYKGHYPKLREMEFWIPPLPEQKKIASILTSVDEVIENTQKQIDKLQDLKKATMNELLTKGIIGHTEFKDSKLGRIPKSWDVVSLSDLAFIDRESLSSSTSPDYQFFYIDITSVKTCFINIPSTQIKYGDSPSRARRVVRKGDVLLSTVRPNLKAFAYVENDCLDWVCSTGFSVLSPKDGNDGRFIFYSVLSEFVAKQIEALVVGSNYPAINSTDVKSLLVLRPSLLSEQKKIASALNSIDTCIKDKQEKLYQTQSLKKSLMQDLLTGKVRVKVN